MGGSSDKDLDVGDGLVIGMFKFGGRDGGLGGNKF